MHHSTLRPSGLVGCLLLAALLLPGCGEPPTEKIIYKDHPVEFADNEALNDVQGDPELIIGVYEEQLFRDVADGDGLPIVQGFQGGTWVHISLRAFGVLADGRIEATLGEGLGQINYPLKLTRSPEGFLEAYDIPIPVRAPGDDLETLFGTTQTLRVLFEAEDVQIQEELQIVLEGGP